MPGAAQLHGRRQDCCLLEAGRRLAAHGRFMDQENFSSHLRPIRPESLDVLSKTLTSEKSSDLRNLAPPLQTLIFQHVFGTR